MSNIFNKIQDWENMSVSQIMQIVVKWNNIEMIVLETKKRDNVESGVWHEIMCYNKNHHPVWSVSSQSMPLLKERLITQLDKLNLRKDYLKRRNENKVE